MTQARDLADGKFDTNTLVVDAANNRVGIGTTSPALPFEVNGSTNVAVFRSDASNSIIQLANSTGTGGDNGTLVGSVGDHLYFRAGDSEKGRFLSGGGLTFNGDTAAANALDDYEEGTWTPVFQDAGGDTYTGSYAAQRGKYTKVGNMVTVWAQLNATNSLDTHGLTGGEGVRIYGLPFTSLNEDSNTPSHAGSAGNVNGINFPSGYTQINPVIGRGITYIILKLAGDNVSDASVTCSNFQSGEIFLCVNYRAT